MISIISITDGVLRDRAAALKIVGGRLHVVGAHLPTMQRRTPEVDADSSAFELARRGGMGVRGRHTLPMPFWWTNIAR